MPLDQDNIPKEDAMAPTLAANLRLDLQLIADMIEPESRVLDIGCGDGALLDYLAREKNVDGRGIEISQEGVNACVSHGLSVIQGDADTDLANYPANAFDYVVLGQTLQATHQPRLVLEDLVRIGRHAVVSFNNFGHWRTRLSLLVRGRAPVRSGSVYGWYDSPDIHLCTILDFVWLSNALGLTIEKGLSVGRDGKARVIRSAGHMENLLGEQAIFLLRQG
ncbi:MAG: methionine biosynthesis protein MetW [Rhodospirillaceae bacterium]|jgi:methionine biosynthesis protein MetW|nr:methionine biosynthesis protein MetW [Rhodospirillaceae bacterium]MBT5458269.1 methionine biosynthesis protein MetW [Rhodospirillaceae bacterium]